MSAPENQPEESVRQVLASLSPLYFRGHSPDSVLTACKRYDELYDETTQETVLPLTGFKSAIHAQPDLVFGCLSMSIHCLLLCEGVSLAFPRVFVRLANYPYTIDINDIKSGVVGRFLSVRGTITGVSSIRPLVQSMSFECTSCKAQHNMIFSDGQYAPPSLCEFSECKSRSFLPLRSTVDAEDWQHARLQENMEKSSGSGATPSCLEVELRNDQVDRIRPGQAVAQTGTVKSRRAEGARANKSQFVLYQDVNHVQRIGADDEDDDVLGADETQLKARDRVVKAVMPALLQPSALVTEKELGDSLPFSILGVDFVYKDLLQLHKLAGMRAQYGQTRLQVHSQCPSQFGLHAVKLGLLLGMLGGCRDNKGARSDVHVLLVGEPGQGKSQLLKSCAKLAVKGMYLGGNTSTVSGQTAAVHREKRDSAFSLEPGALVICDQGVCCIDELDKMGNDQIALLEAMEQQTVSLSKAGVSASLPARTTILAAANPKKGVYDRSKTLQENVKITSPQQNRFDLSFLLIDQADEDKDRQQARHVVGMFTMASNSGNNNNNNNSSSSRNNGGMSGSQYMNNIHINHNNESQILHYIKQSPETSVQPAPQLRKFLVFARECVRPVFSSDARQPQLDFFLTLREKGRSQEGQAPITTRQLESQIRQCEARAKLEQRSVVTKSDAEDVVALFSDTQYKQLIDEHGAQDLGRNTRGTSAATGNVASRLLQNMKSRDQDLWPERQIKELARSMGQTGDQIDRTITLLNTRGDIQFKGRDGYSIPSNE